MVEDPVRPRATVMAAAHQSRFVDDSDDVDDACLRALRRLWEQRCAQAGWHSLETGTEGPRLFCGSEALHAGTPLEVLLADGRILCGTYEYTLSGDGLRPLLYIALGGFGAPRAALALDLDVLTRVPGH